MLQPMQGLSGKQRRLLSLFSRLAPGDQDSLFAFAEFLAARQTDEKPADEPPAEPRPIHRPENETVVGAIRRLSSSYFMLDKADMLDETASLMTEHILRGRPAPEVIDKLEVVFERQYRQRRSGDGD